MQNKTVKELKEIAKERGLTGISKLKKAELLELLREPTIDETFLKELPSEIEVIQYKNGDEWLETRKLGIGGSDVSGILGESKYKSAVDVWSDKIYGSNFKGNRFTEWGHKLEPIVAEKFSEDHPNYKVEILDRTMKRGFSLANIDRLLVDENGNYGVLECKTTSAFNNKAWSGDDIPQEYYCQVMHYLAVTGLHYAYIACLIGGQDYKEFYIERNEEECKYLLEYVDSWWKTYIETQVPPPADGSKAYTDYQKTKLEKLDQIEVEITDLEEKVSKYNLIQEEIKQKELEAELIKQELLDKLIDAGGRKAQSENHKIVVLSRNTSSVDKKALTEKYPQIAENYRKAEEEFKTTKETRYLKIS